jgi:hypothetical protein
MGAEISGVALCIEKQGKILNLIASGVHFLSLLHK